MTLESTDGVRLGFGRLHTAQWARESGNAPKHCAYGLGAVLFETDLAVSPPVLRHSLSPACPGYSWSFNMKDISLNQPDASAVQGWGAAIRLASHPQIVGGVGKER